MRPEIVTVIKLRVSPDDLRELAAEEERKWREARVGQSAVFAERYGDDCKVEFLFDQENLSLKTTGRPTGKIGTEPRLEEAMYHFRISGTADLLRLWRFLESEMTMGHLPRVTVETVR